MTYGGVSNGIANFGSMNDVIRAAPALAASSLERSQCSFSSSGFSSESHLCCFTRSGA